MEDNVCNLECVKKKKKEEPLVHEFIGPVKIVLVEQTRKKYMHKRIAAAFIVLALMLIAVTAMTILFHTLTFELGFSVTLHIVLCTAGYQFCMPSAILIINKLNGSAAPMKEQDRKFEHMCLQLFGVVCSGAGSVVVFLLDGVTGSVFTIHSYAGLAAGGLSVLSIIFGIFAYVASKSFLLKIYHKLFGVLTFLAASTCFILGLLKPCFKSWVPLSDFVYILIAFCVIYTCIVIYAPLKLYNKEEN